MSETLASMEDRYEPQLYEIRLKGHLEARWAEWFDGLALTALPGGETLLSGWLPDQAALRGVLDRLFDLNLELLSVSQVAAEPSQGQLHSPAHPEIE